MIRVLHVLTDSNIGGAGRLLVNYLHNFDREKFEIAVALPRDSALIPCVEAEGWPVLPMEHGRDKSFEWAAIGELKTIIRDWKPDIVHTHSALSAKTAAWLCRVPVRFYTRHCAFDPPKKLTTFPGKQLNGLVNNTLATDIVAVAEAAKQNLTDTGVDDKKIAVIINGVEPMRETRAEERASLRASLGIGENTFVCGISARLESYKGHAYLLDTVKTVVEAEPDTVFLFVGGGSEEAALKEKAERLGITESVRFIGFVDDVAPYLNLFDLNLNCSYGTETSSLALSEGMSLSIPAVATTYGGNPYMVENGVNGLLVPVKDSDAMAAAILSLIRDRAKLAELAEGALRRYRERFTADAMTRQLEVLYEAAVAREKRGR